MSASCFQRLHFPRAAFGAWTSELLSALAPLPSRFQRLGEASELSPSLLLPSVRNLDELSVETRGVGHVDAGSGPGQSRTFGEQHTHCPRRAAHTLPATAISQHTHCRSVIVVERYVDPEPPSALGLASCFQRLHLHRSKHTHFGHPSKHTHFDPFTEPPSALGLASRFQRLHLRVNQQDDTLLRCVVFVVTCLHDG